MRGTRFAAGLVWGMVWGVGAAGAAADPYDNTTLFRQGGWSVEHTYAADTGSSWCAADTTNDLGQSFSVVAYDFGGAAVFVGDPRWRLAERGVRFRIDVDQDRWDIDGMASDAFVSVLLTGDNGASDFVGQLMQGATVAIYNGDDRRLAAFSLSGSDAALTAFFQCWSRIDASDAFARVSDPF